MKEIKNDLNFVLSLANKFKEFKEDSNKLISAINDISKDKIKEQLETYKGKRIDGPVKNIRNKVLEILEIDSLTTTQFEKIKEETANSYEKNVLKGWKDFGILYTIFYNYHREKVRGILDKLVEMIEDDMGLKDVCKYKPTDFDGSQNQGQTQIWCAIYNKTHKNQQTAKQLYFGIGGDLNPSGISYGLYIEKTKSKKDIVSKDMESFSYNDLIKTYQKHKLEIINDIFNEGGSGTEKEEIKENILKNKKQIILYGPPGTGKTYSTKKQALEIIKNEHK